MYKKRGFDSRKESLEKKAKIPTRMRMMFRWSSGLSIRAALLLELLLPPDLVEVDRRLTRRYLFIFDRNLNTRYLVLSLANKSSIILYIPIGKVFHGGL